MNNLYPYLAGLIAGILGAMGLGGGGVLIVYLTFFAGIEQLTSQGINLMFFIPTALLAVIIYIKRGQIKPKSLLPYIAAGLPGAALGTYLGGILGNGLLSRFFGGALLILGIKEMFTKN